MIYQRCHGKKSQCIHNYSYEIIILMIKNIYSYNKENDPEMKENMNPLTKKNTPCVRKI